MIDIKRIDSSAIENLHISYSQCNDWIRESFLLKEASILPVKTSIRLSSAIFITTMPCAIPAIGIGGVKIVSRYPNRSPSLDSIILLFKLSDGKVFAEIDGNPITTMRTGAVAALSVNLFAKENFNTIGMVGLGCTARSTLHCITEMYHNKNIKVNLVEYKNQADIFQKDFAHYNNISFSVYSRAEDQKVILPHEFINHSDVLISCITSATGLFADDTVYQPGILLVPVHTRGFQNCDRTFDKIFGDDTEHIKHFEFFDKFKSFTEISDVLLGKACGRTSNSERIIAYSVGIAIHDVYFAWKIYQEIMDVKF